MVPRDELSKVINVQQTEIVWNILRIACDFTDGSHILWPQAAGYPHFVEIRIRGEGENGRLLILPTEFPDSSLARRFEDGDLNRLTMNASIALIRLIGRDGLKRFVRHCLDKAISQRVEHCAACLDCLCVRHMLLDGSADRAIVYYRSSRNSLRAGVDRHGWI
jgi:hypothetical protein